VLKLCTVAQAVQNALIRRHVYYKQRTLKNDIQLDAPFHPSLKTAQKPVPRWSLDWLIVGNLIQLQLVTFFLLLYLHDSAASPPPPYIVLGRCHWHIMLVLKITIFRKVGENRKKMTQWG